MYNLTKRKMKKILMTLAAIAMAATVNAQVYVGGTAGIGSMKVGDADNETAYKFLPEVGYNINNDWAVGVAFGWTKGDLQVLKNNVDVNSQRMFQVNPYVRNTFVHTQYFNVFADLGFSYAHVNGYGDAYGIGITPGLAVNLSEKLSFVTKVAYVGWQHSKAKASDVKSDFFGVDIDATNVQFGLYYNF